ELAKYDTTDLVGKGKPKPLISQEPARTRQKGSRSGIRSGSKARPGRLTDCSTRFDRIGKRSQTRLRNAHQHRHVSRLVLVAEHLHVRVGYFRPGEDLGHAGVEARLEHQLVRRARLFVMGEMAALDPLLMHPAIARRQ